jgi:hypothetical protein
MKKIKKDYRINDTMMTEQEFKNFVFGKGKVVSVKDELELKSALEKGDYVIGVGYNPFYLFKVFHYENGKLKIYNFEEGSHVEPLNLELVSMLEVHTHCLQYLARSLNAGFDDLLINPTKDMLNLDDIHKVDYNADVYCAFGIPANKRNCNSCSRTHYGNDCNLNPIRSSDDD